jgi:hypothetical protein
MSWFFEKADKITPTDDWDFYFCRVDDSPASIYLDLGRTQSAPLKGKDHLGYLRLYMLKPRPDGLSSDTEFKTLTEIEDYVEKRLRKDCGAVFVGRNTSSGCRDFYFYVANLSKFIASAKKSMQNYPDYTFEADGREDPEWSAYFNFLYPNPYQKQCILNRRVCEGLEEAGDDLSLERSLDHRVYFEDAEQKSAFEAKVVELGFVLREHHDDDFPMACDFSKSARPTDADEVLADLLPVVKEFGGDYDGWGCEAVGALSVKSN